jgi:hypothetical protein
MATNVHKVDKQQWKRWSKAAQKVFNRLYFFMGTQKRYKHPGAPRLKRNHWSTVRWNAAWSAAQITDGKW